MALHYDEALLSIIHTKSPRSCGAINLLHPKQVCGEGLPIIKSLRLHADVAE
jgi:hypothetical protein